MRKVWVLSCLLVMTMLLSSMGSLVLADSSKVIIVVPSGTVDEGTDVDIEVHVFDEGEHAAPTIVQAFDTEGDEVSLSEKSTGVWTGRLTAQDDMISANAEIESKEDSTYQYLQVRSADEPEDLEIIIEPKAEGALIDPQPGDKIDFTIQVYKNGVLKDESTLEVYASSWNEEDSDEQKLAHNKVSTGVYETSFTIPQITRSTTYEIEVQVGEPYWDYFSSPDFRVDFFKVWYHKVAISTTESTFDVYVADMAGKAVSGAIVKLDYYYYQTDSWDDIYEEAGQSSTDKSGKATYTITYSKVERRVYVEGTVEAQGKIQDFEGDILITSQTTPPPEEDPCEPYGFGFEVIIQKPCYSFYMKPGKTESLDFIAYHTQWFQPTEVLDNQVIYYYIYTYSKFISSGSVTSNADGLFTLSITTPTIKDEYDSLYIDFETEVTASNWYETTKYIGITESSYSDYLDDPEKLKDTSVKITVDKLKVGGTSTVTGTYTKGSKSAYASMIWMPGKVTISDIFSSGDTQPDWEPLTGGDYFTMSKKGTSYKSDIVVPEFLPKGYYTVFVIVFDYEGEFTSYEDIHINYIQVKAGEGGTTGGGTSGGILGLGTVGGIDVGLLLIMLIVLIVVILVVVMVVAKRRKKDTAVHAQPYGVPPAGYAQQDTQPQQPQPGYSSVGSEQPMPPAGGAYQEQDQGAGPYGAPPQDPYQQQHGGYQQQQGQDQYGGPPPPPKDPFL